MHDDLAFKMLPYMEDVNEVDNADMKQIAQSLSIKLPMLSTRVRPLPVASDSNDLLSLMLRKKKFHLARSLIETREVEPHHLF